jgi:fumarate reductase subunit D
MQIRSRSVNHSAKKFGVSLPLKMLRETGRTSCYPLLVSVFHILLPLFKIMRNVCVVSQARNYITVVAWLFCVILCLFLKRHRTIIIHKMAELSFHVIIIGLQLYEFLLIPSFQLYCISFRYIIFSSVFGSRKLITLSRVALGNPTANQLIKELFYETRSFIAVFTIPGHWSLIWARWIQSASSRPVYNSFDIVKYGFF